MFGDSLIKIVNALIIIIYLSSCSNAIISLDDFEKSELNSTKLSPSSFELHHLKYRVFTTNPTLSKILSKFENVSLVDDIDLSEYIISLNIEKKVFSNRTLSIGNIDIRKNENNITVEKIPIFDANLNSPKVVNELKSLFAIKRGFIIEKMVNRDDEPIFKINIGKKSGLKEGVKLNIYNYKKIKSYLYGDDRVVLYKVGIGVVSRFIGDNYSWIYLQDNRFAHKISFGSLVTVKRGGFDTYLKDGKLFMKNNDEILNNKIRINLPKKL